MAGMVLGIYFADPEHLVAVRNIKKRYAILKYLREHQNDRDYPFRRGTVEFIEKLINNKKTKMVPIEFSEWVFGRWQVENIHHPKTDSYGLPGGEIDDYEIEKYPNDYFDYALPREFAEETGLLAIKETEKQNENGKKIMENLFRRSSLLWAKDKNEESGKTYENYFFHVFDVNPKSTLNPVGVDGETEPAELVPIAELGRRDVLGKIKYPFYPKHAMGLKIFLQQTVDAGHKEYEEALKHIEETFPQSPEQRGLSYIKIGLEPTIVLTDDENWLKATKGVKKI